MLSPALRTFAGRRKQNAKGVRERRAAAAAAPPAPPPAAAAPPPAAVPPPATYAPPPPQYERPPTFGQSMTQYFTIGVGMTLGIVGFSAVLRMIGF